MNGEGRAAWSWGLRLCGGGVKSKAGFWKGEAWQSVPGFAHDGGGSSYVISKKCVAAKPGADLGRAAWAGSGLLLGPDLAGKGGLAKVGRKGEAGGLLFLAARLCNSLT